MTQESSTTTEQSAPAPIRSSDLLDTKRYNQFTWWTDSAGWTFIADYECNEIARWMRTLNENEVAIWCDGYENGHRRGIEEGKIIKAGEVRRAIGV